MPENNVYIGQKPAMSYVMAIMTAIERGSVSVQARGRAISRAVDVIEILKRFLKITIDGIEIGTEQMESLSEDHPRNVSTINIKISRS